MLRPLLVAMGGIVAVTALGHAEPKDLSKLPAGTVIGTNKLVVLQPPEAFSTPAITGTSNVLYINRCTGGCTVTGNGINDAVQNYSSIAGDGANVLGEYQNDARETGAAADAEWNAIVQCIREVYSPYNIKVVTEEPTSGRYTEAMIAGTAAQLQLSVGQGELLGVAPAQGCGASENAISFSFANSAFYFSGDSQFRIWELCATAAQESAHVFGLLDHLYEYQDGTSACNDPMTYRTDCGGEKFFRNRSALCGEFAKSDCTCGAVINSHLKLLDTFGPGMSIVPAPTVTIDSPKSGSAMDGQTVVFRAGSKRGVAKSELYLNGWKWGEVPGAKFTATGQLNPAQYSIKFPAGVPNGVIDIMIKSYDDLGLATESAVATVTKGAACTAADQCATGQKCEQGKCFWEAPTGKLGDACGYEQFCTSNICAMTDDGNGYCSQTCVIGGTDACPMGFDCVAAGTGGLCLPIDQGGCCSVGTGGAVWVHGCLSALVLGMMVRRRRRR